ncbi:unnamed protein product [Sphenostylis stenocarpa]|uniref:Dienelactone hydrolase domain-containing protein n=1 Tax=Sphenostylis stenocarpa TaxID=92480 RepID=A0AA86SI76_9FABA|nr:unnamed protein product [Sphenostylis stenocarpa]
MVGGECYSNPPLLNASSGGGYVTNIGGINSYVTGSPLAILAILLVSDVYGFKAPLLRKVADKVAANGYYVLVPDFLHDDPYDPKNSTRPTSVWLKDHEPGKSIKGAKPVIKALKRKGVSAVGVAGFCWGGELLYKLTECKVFSLFLSAKTVTNLGKAKLVQASVLLHPSYITVDDIRGVNVPIAILGAEHDSLSPPKLLKQFKQILDAKPEIDSYVKVFRNVSHGWTLRYDPNDPKANGAGMLAEHKEKRDRKMVGSECYSNPPLLNASSGVGYVTNIGGVSSYVTGSPLAILAILLVSDVYGNIISLFITTFVFL